MNNIQIHQLGGRAAHPAMATAGFFLLIAALVVFGAIFAPNTIQEIGLRLLNGI